MGLCNRPEKYANSLGKALGKNAYGFARALGKNAYHFGKHLQQGEAFSKGLGAHAGAFARGLGKNALLFGRGLSHNDTNTISITFAAGLGQSSNLFAEGLGKHGKEFLLGLGGKSKLFFSTVPNKARFIRGLDASVKNLMPALKFADAAQKPFLVKKGLAVAHYRPEPKYWEGDFAIELSHPNKNTLSAGRIIGKLLDSSAVAIENFHGGKQVLNYHKELRDKTGKQWPNLLTEVFLSKARSVGLKEVLFKDPDLIVKEPAVLKHHPFIGDFSRMLQTVRKKYNFLKRHPIYKGYYCLQL